MSRPASRGPRLPRARRSFALALVVALLVPAHGTAAGIGERPAPENPVFFWKRMDVEGLFWNTRLPVPAFAPFGASTPEDVRAAIGYPHTIVTDGCPDRELDESNVPAPGTLEAEAACETRSTQRIHELGARAFKYVQFFWYPDTGKTYQGIRIGNFGYDYAFCSADGSPNRFEKAPGEFWVYYDSNERAARNAQDRYLTELRSWGYDGVYVDIGGRALNPGNFTGGGEDPKVWGQESGCTAVPIVHGRPFADAQAAQIGRAKVIFGDRQDVWINYGASIYTDPKLRPDPADDDWDYKIRGNDADGDGFLDCNQVWQPEPAWSTRPPQTECALLDDMWRYALTYIDESRKDTRVSDAQNARAERDGRLGDQVLVMERGADFDTMLRQWADDKLHDIPVFTNTGDSCRPGDDCSTNYNQLGLFPELVNASLGTPLAAAPGTFCDRAGQCLQYRRYDWGLVVVNRTTEPAKLGPAFPLGVGGCRHLWSVGRPGGRVAGGCLTTLHRAIPPNSGRVYLYRTTRWCSPPPQGDGSC